LMVVVVVVVVTFSMLTADTFTPRNKLHVGSNNSNTESL
jgi:capsule polysaccharide export protein KpsE/RkpR